MLPLTALLANADPATFNLLRKGWFIPSDNIEGIAADYPEDRPGNSSTTTSLGPTPRADREGDQVSFAPAG